MLLAGARIDLGLVRGELAGGGSDAALHLYDVERQRPLMKTQAHEVWVHNEE